MVKRTTKCNVCGDKATDHNHYGGTACYSCRAFFRRGSNLDMRKHFCKMSGNCQITEQTRKNCISCRYNKCLSVGMRREWIMTEKEKHELQLKKKSAHKLPTSYDRRMKCERIRKQKIKRHGRTDSSLPILLGCLSKTEENVVTIEAFTYCSNFASNQPKLDQFIGIFTNCLLGLFRNLKILQDFHEEDKNLLLETHKMGAICLYFARLFDAHHPNFATAFQVSGQKFEFRDFFAPFWASTIEIEEEFRKYIFGIIHWNLDEKTYTLMVLLFMTRIGNLRLKNPDMIFEVHEKLQTTLSYHLQTINSPPSTFDTILGQMETLDRLGHILVNCRLQIYELPKEVQPSKEDKVILPNCDDNDFLLQLLESPPSEIVNCSGMFDAMATIDIEAISHNKVCNPGILLSLVDDAKRKLSIAQSLTEVKEGVYPILERIRDLSTLFK